MPRRAQASRALKRYRDKRDFARTSEPSGRPRRSSRRLEFVIQRHHARRLHYDFRLEWDGVLKSWAVPKGPSLDPAQKRLAVQVEDHPFEYRTFSGEIPAGEYGAGKVVVWDRGTWTPEGDVARGLASGKLDFTLEGERLHGQWSLVRLGSDAAPGKQNWLLIKRRDAYAARTAGGADITELHTGPVVDAPRARTGRTAARAAPAVARRASRRDASSTPRIGAGPKRPTDAKVEFIEPQLATAVEAAPPARPRKTAPAKSGPRRAAAREQPASERRSRVALTHPERVLFPQDGITKLHLAEYYEGIAPVLWPHLKGRPLSLIRSTSSPGRVFFQRHVDARATSGLKPVNIADPGGDGDREPYFVCASEAAIPLLAQLGAVELHTWGSRLPRPEHADRLTFDLDPDPALPWRAVREAATLLRDLLQELGLQSLLKTSGGHGLHVVVPIGAGPTLEIAAAFARRVASHLASVVPDRFAAKRGAANRKGKVYVDWQRNQFAATTVSAYSPRHRPGVPVSLPIAWDELGREDLRGAHYHLRNVIARVAADGDAWSASLPLRQALTRRVIDRLEAAAGQVADD